MMNGRQRCGHGIVSHESGRTTRKKSAKVAVGKSTGARRLGLVRKDSRQERGPPRSPPAAGTLKAAASRGRRDAGGQPSLGRAHGLRHGGRLDLVLGGREAGHLGHVVVRAGVEQRVLDRRAEPRRVGRGRCGACGT